jgi:sugar phosphate isomerase/epimerase
VNRRTFLASSAAVAMAAPAPDEKRTSLGIATTSYMTARRFRDTLEFLEHCHKLGAPGIQTALTSLDRAYLDKVKARLHETGMYIEVMSALPKVDMAQFLATVDGAKYVGAHCIRAGALSGRRYETFATLDDWRKFVSDAKAAIARAVPVVEKARIPLALENHKDWTVDEMVTLLKNYSSEFGALLDTGNNISLLDDPMEVIERLAPFAIATHIKDMGVAEYPDGFLLSEVVIGEGFLNIPNIVSIIRKARPKANMVLEMITRDPLKVPVYTDKYWATFPDRSGIYMARTLRLVRDRKSKLPMFSNLSKEKQIEVEEDNVKRCLAALPV